MNEIVKALNLISEAAEMFDEVKELLEKTSHRIIGYYWRDEKGMEVQLYGREGSISDIAEAIGHEVENFGYGEGYVRSEVKYGDLVLFQLKEAENDLSAE